MESKSLLNEMHSIFGTAFGGSSETVRDIHEEIKLSLTEGRKAQPMAPGPKEFRGKSKFKGAAKKSGSQRKEKRSEKRYRETMSSVGKDMDAAADQTKGKGADLQKALGMLKKIMAKGGNDGKQAEKAAQAAKGGQGGGGSGGSRPMASGGGGGGGGGQHTPFKRSPNLGKGPGTPPGFKKVRGKVYHDQVKCWKCSCGDVYKDGCRCVGTGATEDCPSGKIKKVKIKYGYRQAYNKMYHKWRGDQGGQVTARIAKGGRAA